MAADLIVRPYRPSDRAAVRAICCATAYRNRGASAVFEDEALFADYWTRYFTDFTPEWIWVAERDRRVVGYVLGCADSVRFARLMSARIVPRILASLLCRLATGRYRRPETYRFLRWAVCKSWREAPPVPRHGFPAHYHCNIAAGGHGQRLYSRLVSEFVHTCQARGGTRIHGVQLEWESKSTFKRLVDAFSLESPGWLEYYAERPTDFGRDVLLTDRPMVNRAYGFAIGRYAEFLRWLGERQGF